MDERPDSGRLSSGIQSRATQHLLHGGRGSGRDVGRKAGPRPHGECQRAWLRQVVTSRQAFGSLSERRHQGHSQAGPDGGLHTGELDGLCADLGGDAMFGQGFEGSAAERAGVIEGSQRYRASGCGPGPGGCRIPGEFELTNRDRIGLVGAVQQ
jgi:hypothetical protein